MLDIIGPLKLVKAQGKAAYPYCHCLYVDGEVKALFDTGAGKRSLAELPPEKVDMVFYTHFHTDHTNGHGMFNNAFYHIHLLDYPPMVSREKYMYYTGTHLWRELVGEPVLDYGKLMRERHPDPDFPDVGFREKNIDRTFKDGEVFDFGQTRAVALHTPGHTPGHTAFFFEQEGVVFTGDIDLIKTGPWYGAYLSNIDDFIDSIKKIKQLKARVLVSCHRRPLTENIENELDAYLGRLLEQERQVLEALRVPASLDELAAKGIIYSRHPHAFYLFWEKVMLVHHLERLERQGRVVLEGEKWRLTGR